MTKTRRAPPVRQGGISWTGETWNPWAGCSLVSPGCTNCYAMTMAGRLAANPITPWYRGTVQKTKTGAAWTGTVKRAPDRKFCEPERWRTPRLIFVNSMSDFWHPGVPRSWREDALAVMRRCPHHTFQILTKRPESVAETIPGNVWVGTSVEDRARLARLNGLRRVAATVRFVSAEPLLEDLGAVDLSGIDWVIIGGESGPRARPFEPAWARSLRDQCRAQGVALHVKQMGGRTRPLPPIPPDLQIREWPWVAA